VDALTHQCAALTVSQRGALTSREAPTVLSPSQPNP